MNKFLLSEQFRLEIKWKKVLYKQDGRCELLNAHFTGPVIQIAQKINDNDHMLLDFYSQYFHLVNSVYVATLSWEKVTYSDDGSLVFLDNVFLSHRDELNNVPNLKNDDYFVIDTSNHITEKHGKNLVYKTYLINSDHKRYNFNK